MPEQSRFLRFVRLPCIDGIEYEGIATVIVEASHKSDYGGDPAGKAMVEVQKMPFPGRNRVERCSRPLQRAYGPDSGR